MKSKSIYKCIISFCIVFLSICYFCGIRTFIVMSGSMEPHIKTGSVCIVNTSTLYENVRNNDIITYKLLNGNITHRVVKKYEQGLKTKGDANDVCDLGLVTKEMYIGKVIGHISYIGYVFYFIRKRILYVVMVVGVMIISWNKMVNVFKQKGRLYES